MYGSNVTPQPCPLSNVVPFSETRLGKPLLALWYPRKPSITCLTLFSHWVRRAASTAGNSRAIKMPMMAITTSNSTNVKPRRFFMQTAFSATVDPFHNHKQRYQRFSGCKQSAYRQPIVKRIAHSAAFLREDRQAG